MPVQKKTPKPREVTHRLEVNPFNYTVEIVFTEDMKRSAEDRHIFLDREFDAVHCGVVGKPFSVMFLPIDTTVDVIAHEVFHCVWHIMDVIGAEHENEVMAYTLSFILGEIFTKMKKARRTVRPSKKRAKLA